MVKLTTDQKKIIMDRLRTELRKRIYLRMQNLTEEGFTVEEATEIILEDGDAER